MTVDEIADAIAGKRRPKQLRNIELSEISLVDKPANLQAKVSIFKAAGAEPDGDPMAALAEIEKAQSGRDAVKDRLVDAIEKVARERAAESGQTPETEFVNIIMADAKLAKLLD